MPVRPNGGVEHDDIRLLRSLSEQSLLSLPFVYLSNAQNSKGNGPNSRTSQMFISLSKSGGNFGVELWETPVGQVIDGMEVVKQFYSGYGDMPPVSRFHIWMLWIVELYWISISHR
jgi:hypothetical protein